MRKSFAKFQKSFAKFLNKITVPVVPGRHIGFLLLALSGMVSLRSGVAGICVDFGTMGTSLSLCKRGLSEDKHTYF